VAAILAIGLVICTGFVFRPVAETQRRAEQRRAAKDYSRFSHPTHVTDQKLACESCHKFPTSNWKEVRKGDAAFPDIAEFPQHESCLNCHRPQFFARERPAPAICSNCHVAVTPRNTARFQFPSLGEPFLATARAENFVSEFRVAFPHPKHEDQSCDDCHQTYQPQEKSATEYVTQPPKNLGDAFWLKKGTFKTRPLTHTTCFTCHNEESELAPLPKNCASCHKFAPAKASADFDQKLADTIGVKDWWTLTAWRNRTSAGAFRHEIHGDLELKCAQCHKATITSIENTRAAVPVRSCGGAEGCHVTATTDEGGTLNYEIEQKKKDASFVCTKCHLVFGRQAVPASHLSAIPRK
jgi:hypothetical protein